MERDVMGDKIYGPDELFSDDPIPVMHFAFRSHFQKFTTDLSKIMVKYMNRNPYNSVSSFVRFYEEFKKQDSDLMTFYDSVHQPSVQKDSQNCIGKNLYLRRKLLKHGGKEYNLEHFLYIASSNPYMTNDIPARYHNELPPNTGGLKDHSCLMLQFTLESEKRRGFLIMDTGFLIDFPVVVMKDGQAPDSGRFQMISKTGERWYNFSYFNDNYVYWQTEKHDLSLSQESSPEHRWFYVGKKLENLRQIEKRNRLNTYHALAFSDLGGSVVSLFIIVGAKDYAEISVQDGDVSSNMHRPPNFLTYKIPFTYFLPEGGPRVPEWEHALKVMDEKFRRFGDVYDLLRRTAVLCTDVQFVKEVSQINTAWRAIIEPSFNP